MKKTILTILLICLIAGIYCISNGYYLASLAIMAGTAISIIKISLIEQQELKNKEYRRTRNLLKQ